MIWSYPSGSNVTTRVTVRGKLESGNQRCDSRNRDGSDGSAGLEDRRRPRAKECGQLLEAGKARKRILPWSLQKEDIFQF